VGPVEGEVGGGGGDRGRQGERGHRGAGLAAEAGAGGLTATPGLLGRRLSDFGPQLLEIVPQLPAGTIGGG
jgi:hypothetical protein